MWIRSQYKEILMECKKLCIELGNNGYDIYNREQSWGTRLGTYKTEERALEVLDEIQEHIIGFRYEALGNMSAFGEVTMSMEKEELPRIYNMPKE